jgi:hypothetical protein
LKVIVNRFLTGNWCMFSPDTGDDAGGSAEPSTGVEIDAPVEDSIEYVDEGFEGASVESDTQTQSIEDIAEELRKAREELAAVKDTASPVAALQQTMERFVNQTAPAKPVRKDGATAGINQNVQRMSDEEFQKRFNQKMLEDPYVAQMELQSRTMEPVLQTFAVNQAQVSRELLLSNESNKKFYDRYSDEIEDAVAAVPIVERLKNPKIYQTALAQVKAAHSDEIASEAVSAQVEALLAKKLEELGIKPGEMPPKKTQGTFVAPTSIASRPSTSASTATRQIVVPKWIAEEARIKGIDKGFLYERYRAQGKVK